MPLFCNTRFCLFLGVLFCLFVAWGVGVLVFDWFYWYLPPPFYASLGYSYSTYLKCHRLIKLYITIYVKRSFFFPTDTLYRVPLSNVLNQNVIKGSNREIPPWTREEERTTRESKVLLDATSLMHK